MCWSRNTAGKTCMHCTCFRSVFIESAADAEFESLIENYKIDVNTFFLQYLYTFLWSHNIRSLFYKIRLQVPYHYCHHLTIHVHLILNESVFECIVLYLRSVPVILVITYCVQFLAYPCQWCYIDTFCLYKIGKLSFYCYFYHCLFISPMCLHHLRLCFDSNKEKKSHEPNK